MYRISTLVSSRVSIDAKYRNGRKNRAGYTHGTTFTFCTNIVHIHTIEGSRKHTYIYGSRIIFVSFFNSAAAIATYDNDSRIGTFTTRTRFTSTRVCQVNKNNNISTPLASAYNFTYTYIVIDIRYMCTISCTTPVIRIPLYYYYYLHIIIIDMLCILKKTRALYRLSRVEFCDMCSHSRVCTLVGTRHARNWTRRRR